MTDRLQYGNTAKLLHWLVVALLLVQYPLGWLMPDIHRNMKPGAPMAFHVSVGFTILIVVVLRFALAARAPRCTGEFASVAAIKFGSRALATLCAGPGHDDHWLAVRIVSRLVDVAVLSGAGAGAGAGADAGFGKCRGG